MVERKDRVDAFAASMLIGFSILLGLNQALVKLVNAGFEPVFQGGLRSACAFFVVLIWARMRSVPLNLRDGSLPFGLIAGVLFALEFGLVFVALDLTTVSRVSLFFYTMPFFTAVGAHFLVPGERLSWLSAGGLVLAIAGVALGLSEGGAESGHSWTGDLLAIGGAMAWAGIALVTRMSKLIESPSEQVLLYQLFVSAILLLAVAPFVGDMVRDVTPVILGIFAFQVVAVASLGFLMWLWVLTVYPVTNMAAYSLLAPVFGVFFGWLIFDDPLTWRFVAALALVASGILLINRR